MNTRTMWGIRARGFHLCAVGNRQLSRKTNPPLLGFCFCHPDLNSRFFLPTKTEHELPFLPYPEKKKDDKVLNSC